MLSSKAVWAILLSYFFDGIAFYGVFTSAPMYLQRVLHFDISTVTLLIYPYTTKTLSTLALSSLSLPLLSSPTTSRELLSQFPTCSG